MGGAGGAGGAGGSVTVTNGTSAGAGQTLYTTGAMSSAIVAQSIGGGGGRGGASSSATDGSGVGNVSATLGGSGGSGGNGGSVAVTSGGLVKTVGDHSIGILAQSVGGGGGNSSASSTAAKDSHADGNLSATLGGSGGSGGDGGGVTVTLLSTLVTEGTNAMGIVAQSIGGGGGNAATSQEQATGGKVSLALGLGGSGGSGGYGGAVQVNVGASIGTSGAHATAVLAQSIGGGGGSGGASNNAATSRIALGAGLSGGGGAGGDGGTVTVTLNQQANLVISTSGAHADAVLAQAIGGGGGKAGAGTGKADGASGGDVSLTLALGASGGTGGTGGTVTISDQANGGTIVTHGHESAGLVAQSIGGGGGKGGSAASTGLAPHPHPVRVGGRLRGHRWQWRRGLCDVRQHHRHPRLRRGRHACPVHRRGGGSSASFSNAIDKAHKTDVALTLGLGGSGGAGGSGGQVDVTLSGSILTDGESSIGLVAQSIGGGGGRASAVAAKSNGGTVNGSVSLGADGGTGNVGGTVNVTVSGAIATSGAHSDGVLAQSIGGGGGIMQAASTDFGVGCLHRRHHRRQWRVRQHRRYRQRHAGPRRLHHDHGAQRPRHAPAIHRRRWWQGGLRQFRQLRGPHLRWIEWWRRGRWRDGERHRQRQHRDIGRGGPAACSCSPSVAAAVLPGIMASTVFDISHTSVGTGGGDGNGGAINATVNGSVVTHGANAAAVNLQSIGGGGGAIQTSGVSGIGSAGGTGTGGAITLDVNGTIAANGLNSPGIFAASLGGTGASNIAIAVNSGALVSGGRGGLGAGITLSGGADNTISVAANAVVQGLGGVALLAGAANETVTNAGTVTDRWISALAPTASQIWRVASSIPGTRYSSMAVPWPMAARSRQAASAHRGNDAHGQSDEPGTLAIDVDLRRSRADTLSVSGTADLTGGTVFINPVGIAPNASATYISAASLTGTPVYADNSLVYQWQPVTGTTSGGLPSYGVTAQANFTPAGAGLNPNQQAIAAHLQSVWNAGGASGSNQVFSALGSNSATAAAYQAALSDLSPELLGAHGVHPYKRRPGGDEPHHELPGVRRGHPAGG